MGGFFCPSPLVINVLFTLATLTPYNCDFLILKEFGITTSGIPLHQRAINILRDIVNVVKSRKGRNDDPFSPVPLDDDIINNAEKRLIESVDFIRGNRFRELRTRAFKKTSYKEKTEPKADLLNSPKEEHNKENSTEDSPQKRALNMALRKNSLKDEEENHDDDDEQWARNTVDAKTLNIIKHERIDVALSEGRIWTAISWAFSSSAMTDDPVRQQVWKMWEPILDLFFDIFQIELNLYERTVKDDEDKSVLATLNASRFFEQVSRYMWNIKFAEALLPSIDVKTKHKLAPIYPNELYLSQSQFLEPQYRLEFRPQLISLNSVPIRHKLVSLAMNWINLGGYTQLEKATLAELSSEISKRLYSSGNLDDMILWYRIYKHEENYEQCSFMVEMLMYTLVQMTTYEFDQPDPDWFTKELEGFAFIISLFEKTTFHRKHYSLETALGWESMLLDFSRISLVLHMLFSVWLKFVNPGLDASKKEQLLQLAELGEQKRVDMLDSCRKDYEPDDLLYLTTQLLEPLLEQRE
jgi:hypothetical protein